VRRVEADGNPDRDGAPLVVGRRRRGTRKSGGRSRSPDRRRVAHLEARVGGANYMGGSITVSMTWMTPLDAMMSVVTTLAPPT